MPQTKVVKGFIEYIFRVVFIYGVVSQMHIEIVDVLLVYRLVFLCGESDKTLIVDVDS